MVPGRKFCTSTSAFATSFAITSRPASLLTSMASERLPRLEEMNSAENSPALSMVARLRRVMSPPVGSILRTSAPWSARNIVANGPDTTPVRSSTRTPLSGPGMTFSSAVLFGFCASCRGIPGRLQLSRFGRVLPRLLDDAILDVAQLVLAEKHLPADKEGRRAERTAVDGVAGQVDQLLFDVVLLRPRDQAVDVEPGRLEGRAEDFDVVHLLRLLPHVMIGGPEIRLEHALELGGHRPTHQHQRIHGKERIRPERRDVVAANEALGLKRHVFRLVLDTAQRVERRHVAGGLEYPAEQHRHVVELHAGPPLDRGNDKLGQISVRAAEIEQEFHLERACHGPFSLLAPPSIADLGCRRGRSLPPRTIAWINTVPKLNCQSADCRCICSK